jgi:hypothetical protein
MNAASTGVNLPRSRALATVQVATWRKRRHTEDGKGAYKAACRHDGDDDDDEDENDDENDEDVDAAATFRSRSVSATHASTRNTPTSRCKNDNAVIVFIRGASVVGDGDVSVAIDDEIVVINVVVVDDDVGVDDDIHSCAKTGERANAAATALSAKPDGSDGDADDGRNVATALAMVVVAVVLAVVVVSCSRSNAA